MTEDAKPANGKAEEELKKDRKLLGIEPIETSHQITVRGKTLNYTARAGSMPLTDDCDNVEAEVFFTSYELDGVEDHGSRPLTIAFNGGPGSASIWLHMGALGPKRVVMEPEGWMPAPPYRYEDNVHAWLDQTDLLFIDPVGTGYSRASKPDHDKKFWSYQGDIESVGEVIRLFLTRYARWTSPLFLAGESYGTTRAAALAGHLVDRGIAFNGIVLISTVLDFQSIRFLPANDLPFQLFVPTYAATAWYHQRLESSLQEKSVQALIDEVKAWAEGPLTSALMKGDRLDEVEQAQIAGQLAAYTGIDPTYISGSNLRLNIFNFCKELLRSEKRSVGRLDSRFKGVEAATVNAQPEFDPSLHAITPPYSAAFNHYARTELGVETDLNYETLSFKVNGSWQWDNGRIPATGEILREAMAKNPHMRVFVGQGIYDLATPLFATEYMISHMNIDAALRAQVETENYEAGHMFYLDVDSLAAFREDIRRFIDSAA